MRFETLSDLLEAYKNETISSDTPLIIDEENSIAYIEKGEDEIPQEDEEDEENEEGNYIFYLSLSQLAKEAMEILGVEIEDSE